jgi:cytochrome d ubiquinol oxidase subunit II
MLDRFGDQPWGVIFPAAALIGVFGVGHNLRTHHEVATFLCSCAYLLGMLTATVFALYPDVLPGVAHTNSLTIYNASASNYGLQVGLVWWIIGMALALVYAATIYRLFRGKISEATGGAH